MGWEISNLPDNIIADSYTTQIKKALRSNCLRQKNTDATDQNRNRKQHGNGGGRKGREDQRVAAAFLSPREVYPAKEADESAFLIFLSRSFLEKGFSSSTSPRIRPRALMCSPA